MGGGSFLNDFAEKEKRGGEEGEVGEEGDPEFTGEEGRETEGNGEVLS